ncbi:MAG TPA: hypothetical protein DIU45_15900 [Clostridium sp.]|nr:hypothetical protein [Clostridium sp.]
MNKVSLRNIIIVYISKLRDKIEKDLKGTINLKIIMGLGYRRIYQQYIDFDLSLAKEERRWNLLCLKQQKE